MIIDLLYFWKVGKYTHTHTHIYRKNHVDFKYVYLQKKIIKKKSSRYHCCSNVWNNEDLNAFSVKLLDILILKNS